MVCTLTVLTLMQVVQRQLPFLWNPWKLVIRAKEARSLTGRRWTRQTDCNRLTLMCHGQASVFDPLLSEGKACKCKCQTSQKPYNSAVFLQFKFSFAKASCQKIERLFIPKLGRKKSNFLCCGRSQRKDFYCLHAGYCQWAAHIWGNRSTSLTHLCGI